MTDVNVNSGASQSKNDEIEPIEPIRKTNVRNYSNYWIFFSIIRTIHNYSNYFIFFSIIGATGLLVKYVPNGLSIVFYTTLSMFCLLVSY